MQMTISHFDTSGDDAYLVAQTLQGSRDAFARIVARYQSLICSIGYCATGNLSQSEDLAQETFISAWKQLRDLREPTSLRAWLCGIARNLTNNALRRDGHEPSHAAESIEEASDAPAADLLPADRAINDEEQALLWRSIERIPKTYRDPLVLFYREHQSIEAVCVALDLSEDAVKQRLSRGRKLLTEQVTAFVEGALERSVPGAAFTVAVVAALPSLSTSASAAVIGATAAKGSTMAWSAGFVAVFNLVLGPLLGLLGGYIGYRSGLEATHTPRERALFHLQMRWIIGGVAVFIPTLLVFALLGDFWSRNPMLFGIAGILLPLVFAVWLVRIIVVSQRRARVLREEERLAHPEWFSDLPVARRAFYEYRSKSSLFGVPLVHVQFGIAPRDSGAFGWIAIGQTRAVGIVFAMATTAYGGISVGAISFGIVSVGSLGVGVISLGNLTIGVFSFGAIALGVYALGTFAAAWTAAVGGLAVARDYAWGGYAIAAHANDAIAGEFMLQHHATALFYIALGACALLTIVPGFLYLRAQRKYRRVT
jgi:RNA polymerase sigma factor (sigma-70 family)